jgi:hypothetical protein
VLVLVVLLRGRHFLFDLEQAINDKIRCHVAARESKREEKDDGGGGGEGKSDGREGKGADVVGAVVAFDGDGDGDVEGEGYDFISEIAAGVFVEAFNDVI